MTSLPNNGSGSPLKFEVRVFHGGADGLMVKNYTLDCPIDVVRKRNVASVLRRTWAMCMT